MPNISIVNGEPAEECEWKWQVGLASRRNGRPWCGGMLISPEWVLTAAHCLEGESRISVIAGQHNVRTNSGNEQRRWSSQIIMHPQYNSNTLQNDFGLVRLESAMNMNSCVGTVCLPAAGADVPAGSECWITGWGTLSSGGSSPDVLQEAKVTILSNNACKDTSYGRNEITPEMLCAQGRRNGGITDACQGDSGGPLVCQASDNTWAVYGATSWGYGCAAAEYPGVWARIHSVLDWVEKQMS